jgi:hypothetical protein
LDLTLCVAPATVAAGLPEAPVGMVARLFELSQTTGTRGLKAVGLCPVQRQALTVIAGLGFELFNRAIGQFMIPRLTSASVA